MRHFDVVAEDLKGSIQILAKQVASNTEKLEEHDQRFDKVDEKFEKIDNDLNMIKLDLGIIKNELSQKVSRGGSSVLERRVVILENKAF